MTVVDSCDCGNEIYEGQTVCAQCHAPWTDDKQDDDICWFCSNRSQGHFCARETCSKALDAAMEDRKRMRDALDFFESQIEAQEAYLTRDRGGMGGNLPSMSDFASAPPSTVHRLRWHLRNIRGAK